MGAYLYDGGVHMSIKSRSRLSSPLSESKACSPSFLAFALLFSQMSTVAVTSTPSSRRAGKWPSSAMFPNPTIAHRGLSEFDFSAVTL